MLNEAKKDLTFYARMLVKPYELYSIDELADAYCEAVDNNDEHSKNIYISALVLRFWYTIEKMYKSNTVAPCLEYEDFFWWLYEAIEYACKYRGWQDPDKKLNAQQCINKCINTIKLQKYYNMRLDKNKVVNNCYSIETSLGEDHEGGSRTLADVLEADDCLEDCIADENVVSLIQSYVDRNKIIEAILLDNIAFNDVQKHYKKTVKVKDNTTGKVTKYIEHSSEFWPYRLVQIVSTLPDTYKTYFMTRYSITEDKLTSILSVIDRASNQKLYKYLRHVLTELRASYVF